MNLPHPWRLRVTYAAWLQITLGVTRWGFPAVHPVIR